ncbi:inositol monophosphatase family protein [Neogemmobacter tilapiae]|uniref:Inositol phosphatase n=1 Tax=Neogemmobacter tilapiae TaxID=875041 RepID=A0A918WIL0_9RHOB|nr:inositol monophosphatase [Gemmobacter tilapiae]GHC49667.1 inositol phosphatase [Gemmobacter tilapiae]
MPFDTNDRAELIRIARAVAKAEVMPRFRNLNTAAVGTKKDAHDIVTEADTAAEAALTAAFQTTFPGLDVLGEEAIAANPAIIERLDAPGTTIIIDPIDGTWNYAAGQTNFGMILSVVQDGVTLFGLHLDPVMDDWIWAAPGEGAHWAREGATRPIHARGELPLNQRIGLMSPALFPAEKRPQLVTTVLAYGRALSPRCAAHEYRLIAEGHADFALSAVLNPWDHAAGTLIVAEAGGHAALLDGRPYSVRTRQGVLLTAANKATWDEAAERLSFLM